MRTLHIVEGIGGSRRACDRAAARVVASARRVGWTPSVMPLDTLPHRLPEIERLVLCGGDGLIHRAIQHVAGTAVEVAVVPVGSGNDFARAFGIAGESAVALAAAEPSAAAQPIDLLRADETGVYGATVLTAGYSGRVNATANRMRLPLGGTKYSLAALLEIGRLRPVDVRLTLDGVDGASVEVIEEPLTLLAIGNTGYFGGGMEICPGANPADGIVEVVTVGVLDRLDFVRWLPTVFKGRHCDHRAVAVTRAAAVTIETSEQLWADGEPFGRAPVTVRADPGALRLLTP